MLIAEFSHKGEEIEIENELWQYDYGQRLQIKGLDLPETFEVHFAWKDSEKAKVVIGSTVNGISTVDIPNVALEQRRTITAYIYLSDTTEGETVNTIVLSVNKRKAPENFETPEDVDLFHHTIAATAEYQRQAKESEEQAAAQAADAEAWAHGREDHPDQEQDNAKYYAEQAAASQRAAELSRQIVSDSVTQAQNDIGEAQQQAIKTITEQQGISIQKIKNQTAESEDNLKNTIRAAEQIKTDLDTEVENATPIKQGLDDSNTAAIKTKVDLDKSNTIADQIKAELEVLNTTASKTKTNLDGANKTATDLTGTLESEISEGIQTKKDIQTTGETVISNIQAEAARQQELIKTNIDETLLISGKAADAAAVGKKGAELDEKINLLKEYIKGAAFPETWEQVVLAISSKLYKEMYAVGDKFSNIWKDTNNSNKEYDNPLRINHFENGLELENGTTVDGMWLQTVYAHLKGVQFSHQQAFYVSDEGMTAGTYCIGFDYTWGSNGYVNKGDYWNFTLTKDVPAGGRLAGFYGAPDQPQTNWKVYVYSADGKTVLETVSIVNKGQEGTLLGVMSAYGDENLNGIQQMAYGDNRYATSAIRQYLNSDKPKGEWWTAQTKWDIAPDQLSQIDGYLCGMDPELLAVLKPVKVVTYCNTVTTTGQKQIKDITYDKVTLISLEQMYVNPQIAGEGGVHEYYKELNGTSTKFQQWQTYEILKTFAIENHTSPQNVRLRSVSRGYASNTWTVYSSGNVNGNGASSASRLAPLMFIGAAPSDTISAPTDAENTQENKIQEIVA